MEKKGRTKLAIFCVVELVNWPVCVCKTSMDIQKRNRKPIKTKREGETILPATVVVVVGVAIYSKQTAVPILMTFRTANGPIISIHIPISHPHNPKLSLSLSLSLYTSPQYYYFLSISFLSSCAVWWMDTRETNNSHHSTMMCMQTIQTPGIYNNYRRIYLLQGQLWRFEMTIIYTMYTYVSAFMYCTFTRFERHILFPKLLAHNAEDYNPSHTMYNRDPNKAATARR